MEGRGGGGGEKFPSFLSPSPVIPFFALVPTFILERWHARKKGSNCFPSDKTSHVQYCRTVTDRAEQLTDRTLRRNRQRC